MRAPGTPPPRATLLTFFASKPFQIMRHSVHACHEFNFRLQPSRTEFPTSPPTRHKRSPVSSVADAATKKRAHSLSLCDGNDFPATVASRRPRSNARRGCQRSGGAVAAAASTLLLALLATPFAAYTCFLRLPSAPASLSTPLPLSLPPNSKQAAALLRSPHFCQSPTASAGRPVGRSAQRRLRRR